MARSSFPVNLPAFFMPGVFRFHWIKWPVVLFVDVIALAVPSPELLGTYLSTILLVFGAAGGTAWAAVSTKINRTRIQNEKEYDEAHKELIARKLEESNRQRAEEAEDARRERQILSDQIASLTRQGDEFKAMILTLQANLVAERALVDKERALGEKWRADLGTLTVEVLQKLGHVRIEAEPKSEGGAR